MASRYEGPYRAGVAPGGAADLPGASGEAFGAPVGRGIDEFGRALDRRAIVKSQVEERRTRENEAANAGVAYAEMQGRIESYATTRRAAAEAGAPRHAEEMEAFVDGQINDFMRPWTNERVRNTYREQTAQLRASLLPREQGWEIGQRVEYRGQQVRQAAQITASRLSAMPLDDAAPGLAAAALADVRRSVGLFELPGNESERLVREIGRELMVGFANNLVDNAPDRVEELLGNPEFSSYLNADDVTALRRGSRVELRRRQAQQEAAVANEQATARERIAGYFTGIASGIQYSDAETEEFRGLVETHGTDSHRIHFAQSAADRTVDRETDGLSIERLDQMIVTLEAKNEARTDQEDLQLASLVRVRAARHARIQADPEAAAAASGHAMTQVNWDAPDPAAVDRRVAEARAQQGANRQAVPAIFAPERLRVLQERMGQGPAGQVEVASWLRRQLRHNAQFGMAQVAPPGSRDHQLMSHLVSMPEAHQVWYARGGEALAQNAALWRGADSEEKGRGGNSIAASMRDAFPDQDSFNTAVAIARNVSAAFLANEGQAEFSERHFRTALSEVVGETRRDGRVFGGIRGFYGSHVLLPRDMTSDDFERAIMGGDGAAFGRSAVDRDGNSAPGGAFWMNRRTGERQEVYSGDIQDGLRTSRLRLRTIRPGVYSIVTQDNNPLKRQDGQIWYFAPSRMGQASPGVAGAIDSGIGAARRRQSNWLGW